MKKKPLYIQRAEKTIKGMSNRALFEEMLLTQVPDDYDGCFTTMGMNYKELYEESIRERLKDWLEGTAPLKLPCGHSYDDLILDFGDTPNSQWHAYCYKCDGAGKDEE